MRLHIHSDSWQNLHSARCAQSQERCSNFSYKITRHVVLQCSTRRGAKSFFTFCYDSYDATQAHNQRVTSQNPLKSQDGGKKIALVQKKVSFVAVNISRDA